MAGGRLRQMTLESGADVDAVLEKLHAKWVFVYQEECVLSLYCNFRAYKSPWSVSILQPLPARCTVTPILRSSLVFLADAMGGVKGVEWGVGWGSGVPML